jgi:hypothetical protein
VNAIMQEKVNVVIFDGRTEGESRAYQQGLADGNAAATRLLIGCVAEIHLVVDHTLPEGVAELRVRSVDDIHTPSKYVTLIPPQEA